MQLPGFTKKYGSKSIIPSIGQTVRYQSFFKEDITDLTDPKARGLAYKLDSNGRPVIWSRVEETTEDIAKRRKLRWQFYQHEETKPARGRGLRRRGK